MRLVRYGGAIPFVAFNASRRVLNSARAATGSQWRVRKSGVASAKERCTVRMLYCCLFDDECSLGTTMLCRVKVTVVFSQ